MIHAHPRPLLYLLLIHPLELEMPLMFLVYFQRWRTELDIGTRNVGTGHDSRSILVPDASEHVEAKGRCVELVAERLEGEAVAVAVEFLELGDVDLLTGLLLEEVDAETVGELILSFYPAQGQRSVVGAEGNVGCKEVAALVKGVRVRVGHIRVENDNGNETLALVKDLHAQTGSLFADDTVDDLTGGNL
ncbi:hypothetical protein HG531_008289 [Fusarium graminearum]|nr:hypothetical protein HG531_008289 [Fusarium graminearum]